MRATGDEKVLAELINSYELKEKSYQSELNKQENLIAALKENIVTLDDDILEEIRQKQKA